MTYDQATLTCCCGATITVNGTAMSNKVTAFSNDHKSCRDAWAEKHRRRINAFERLVPEEQPKEEPQEIEEKK